MPTMLGNKPKMIKKIIFAIVEPACFSNFTWTGKASNGKRKNALENLTHILTLVHSIIKTVDGAYCYQLFLRHLKDNVIKYAYE